MTTVMEQVTKSELTELISCDFATKLSKDERKGFNNCLNRTTVIWALRVDGNFVCAWGLVPPTLLSDQAYLWLHTTEAAKEHEFILVRRGQIELAKMLREYPRIIGHCIVGAEQSIRWLKWLGAKFGEPDGRLIPFVIKAKEAASG